ncbi:myb-like dna-binding [Trichoderma cornu-damae]|uniref:Myb-like dna-binding n=1 Tax=Trichoderma cornu-damae TaxID=654480 RepID=A0A9P8QJ43_9HYPO|nr:myb-like dna-binding [Trichoderma cornu-damae]
MLRQKRQSRSPTKTGRAHAVARKVVEYITMDQLNAMTSEDLAKVTMEKGSLPQKKGPWSADESARLLRLAELTGERDWVTVANLMGNRNAKQCRERYHQNLNPLLRHDPITDGEARLIMQYHGMFGSAWARIAEYLPGRSDNCIKNYVNGRANKTRRAQHREAARRRSPTARSAAEVTTPPSSLGTETPESPYLSDTAESEGGNNYLLSSSWGQTPAPVPPRLMHPDWNQPAGKASFFGQVLPPPMGHSQQDMSHPVPRRPDPSLYERPCCCLANCALAAPPFRQPPPELVMPATNQWAPERPREKIVLPPIMAYPPLPSPTPSAPLTVVPSTVAPSTVVPPARKVDPRMMLANII